MSMMRSAKGVPITIIKEGKINVINGTVIMTGRRAARSSKRARRSVRISAATARSDPASGVPNLIDWLSAATMPRKLATPALRAKIVERLIAHGGNAHLCRCGGELLGNLGIAGAENTADLLDRVVQAETGLGTDDE
jgi:hypothetical protein